MFTGNEFRRLDHLINKDVAFVLEANCPVTPDLVDDLSDAGAAAGGVSLSATG